MWHSISPFAEYDEQIQMQVLPGISGEYISALRNLSSLTLRVIIIEHIREDGFHTCFSAFRETLTYLSLGGFTAVPFSASMALVDYFPNVTTLQLEPEFMPRLDEERVLSFSRPPRGKLIIYEVTFDSSGFFNRFARSNLEYEELVIVSRFFVGTKFAKSVLQISTSAVKFLRLARGLRSE